MIILVFAWGSSLQIWRGHVWIRHIQAQHLNIAIILLEVSPKAFVCFFSLVKRVFDLHVPLTVCTTKDYHQMHREERQTCETFLQDKWDCWTWTDICYLPQPHGLTCLGGTLCASPAEVNQLCQHKASWRTRSWYPGNESRFLNPFGTVSSFCRAGQAMWDFVFVL